MAGRLRDWWERLTGRGAEEPEVPIAASRASRPHDAAPAPDQPGELKLADPNSPGSQSHHTGAGGFDPYSSDAGYQKPHSWEHVDHD